MRKASMVEDEANQAWLQAMRDEEPSTNKKVYVSGPHEVPEGKSLEKGPQGGYFYETEGGEAPEKDEAQMPSFMDMELNPDGGWNVRAHMREGEDVLIPVGGDDEAFDRLAELRLMEPSELAAVLEEHAGTDAEPEVPEGDEYLFNAAHDWERFASNVDGADELKHRLRYIQDDEWHDLTNGWAQDRMGEMSQALQDEEVAERWMQMVDGLDRDEKVTTLVALWNQDGRVNRPAGVKHSNVARTMTTLPMAALVSRMEPEDLSEFLDAVTVPDRRSQSGFQEDIVRSIQAYAPSYELRQRAGAFPSNLPTLPGGPRESKEEIFERLVPWFDHETHVLDEALDERSFRVKLINGWVSNPYGPTGNVLREVSLLFGQNPIHRYAEPRVGFGGVTVKLHPDAVPGHVRERVQSLQLDTERYYRQRGDSEVTVYRGVGEPVTTPSPVESWTVSAEFAENYGEHVLEATVPVETILWSTEALGGMDEELQQAAHAWGPGTPESVKGDEVNVMAGSAYL